MEMIMLCFTFNGRKICIPIYYLVWPRWLGPGPDPGPIEIEHISPEVIREVQAIAGIAELSLHLSKETAHLINGAVEASLKVLKQKLPKEVEVELNPQPLPPRRA
jgi:hypothetical protein